MNGPDQATVVLEARDVTKRYGHVQALRGVNLSVRRREIVALVGDNGAGKSTLVKVLAGATRPDTGEILIDGQPTSIPNPPAARALGIETIYQDLALAPTLGAAANLFLGREVARGGLAGRLGVLDKRTMRDQARVALAGLGVRLRDTDVPVAYLSGGQRQSIAIARAATWARRVVFMDEPTAALGVIQTQRVIDLIRRVRNTGTSVVLISHNIPQVLEVADRVVVLRLGAAVADLRTAETTGDELVAAMTGTSTEQGCDT